MVKRRRAHALPTPPSRGLAQLPAGTRTALFPAEVAHTLAPGVLMAAAWSSAAADTSTPRPAVFYHIGDGESYWYSIQ
jgi:hypothetical protein